MWAWAAAEVYAPDNIYYGNSLDTFMQGVCALPDRSCMWFHNLKFDGEFIYNWLFDHGWEWVPDVSESPIRTFTTLISDKGMHYCIQLNVSSNATVEIRDSLKVIPMPVAEIPKAFGLPDAKLELDYKGPREVGHELTPDEKAYITNDVVIVAKALRRFARRRRHQLHEACGTARADRVRVEFALALHDAEYYIFAHACASRRRGCLGLPAARGDGA